MGDPLIITENGNPVSWDIEPPISVNPEFDETNPDQGSSGLILQKFDIDDALDLLSTELQFPPVVFDDEGEIIAAIIGQSHVIAFDDDEIPTMYPQANPFCEYSIATAKDILTNHPEVITNRQQLRNLQERAARVCSSSPVTNKPTKKWDVGKTEDFGVYEPQVQDSFEGMTFHNGTITINAKDEDGIYEQFLLVDELAAGGLYYASSAAAEKILAKSATSQIYLLGLQGLDEKDREQIAAAYQSHATQTNYWKKGEIKHFIESIEWKDRILVKFNEPSPEELARQAYEEEVGSWDISDDPFVGYRRALHVALNGSGDDGWVETANNIRGASFDTSVDDKGELQWEVNTALNGSLVESDTAGDGIRVFERSLEIEEGEVTVTLHYHEPSDTLFAPMYTFESQAGTLTFIDVDLERNVNKGDSVITPHDNVVTTRQSFLMLPADAGTNIDGSLIRTPFLNAAMGETHLFSEAVMDLMAEYQTYPGVQFDKPVAVKGN